MVWVSLGVPYIAVSRILFLDFEIFVYLASRPPNPGGHRIAQQPRLGPEGTPVVDCILALFFPSLKILIFKEKIW